MLMLYCLGSRLDVGEKKNTPLYNIMQYTHHFLLLYHPILPLAKKKVHNIAFHVSIVYIALPSFFFIIQMT